LNLSETEAARTVRRRRRRGGIYGSWSLPQNENGLTYLRIIRSIHTSHSVVLSLRMRDKSGDETELPLPTPPTYIPLCFFGFVSSRIRLPVPRLDATLNGMMRLSDSR